MTKNIRAVIYARYSSDNQREESTTAQLRASGEYMKRKNYVFTGEYVDEEKSGKNDRRQNFQRMISDARAGLFDVVVIHKINRFARNRYDSIIYKRELKKCGVRVESVTEQLDDSPESVILESLLEGMAEYQSLDLAREVMKGLMENAEQGIFTGGTPAYGLMVNPATRKYEIDDRRYPAVEMYVDGLINGWSNKRIADYINAKGFRTATGKIFTEHSFYGWASNRKYRGDYVFNATSPKNTDGTRNSHRKNDPEDIVIKKGIIPTRIEPEKWEKVDQIMSERKKKPGQMKTKTVYLLSGKITCGKCGGAYSANSYTNGRANVKYYYYKCSSKCGGASIRKDEIEQEVMERLDKVCFTPDAIAELVAKVKELYGKKKSDYETDTEPMQNEIRELETKIRNWTEALGSGVKSVIESIKSGEQRIEAIRNELKRAELIASVNEIRDQDIIAVINEKKHLLFSSDEEMKKQVLQEYVDNIIILPDSDKSYKVEITYRVFSGAGEVTLSKTLHIIIVRK